MKLAFLLEIWSFIAKWRESGIALVLYIYIYIYIYIHIYIYISPTGKDD